MISTCCPFHHIKPPSLGGVFFLQWRCRCGAVWNPHAAPFKLILGWSFLRRRCRCGAVWNPHAAPFELVLGWSFLQRRCRWGAVWTSTCRPLQTHFGIILSTAALSMGGGVNIHMLPPWTHFGIIFSTAASLMEGGVISTHHPFEVVCSPCSRVLPLLYLPPPVASSFSFHLVPVLSSLIYLCYTTLVTWIKYKNGTKYQKIASSWMHYYEFEILG